MDGSIPNIEFNSVVWEGVGGKVIHQIISSDEYINVELMRSEKYDMYMPVNVGCTGSGNINSIYDMTPVEIGSLMPLPPHQLDSMRVFQEMLILVINGTVVPLWVRDSYLKQLLRKLILLMISSFQKMILYFQMMICSKYLIGIMFVITNIKCPRNNRIQFNRYHFIFQRLLLELMVG